jgi:hypothetical protein
VYQRLVAADQGRFAGKFCSDIAEVEIPNCVGLAHDLLDDQKGDYRVRVDGQEYFCGKLAQRESNRRRQVEKRKDTEETIVSLLTGIYLVTQPGDDIRLITSLPINMYTPAQKAAMKRLLEGAGGKYFRVNVNNEGDRFIYIRDVMITIEAAGLYFDYILDEDGGANSKYAHLVEGNTYCADLGSRTLNKLHVLDGAWVTRDSRTDDALGTLSIERAAANGGETEGILREYLRNVVASLSETWFDANLGGNLIIGGGGVLKNKDYLREAYPKALIPDDPVKSHVRGMFKLLKNVG